MIEIQLNADCTICDTDNYLYVGAYQKPDRFKTATKIDGICDKCDSVQDMMITKITIKPIR